MKRRRKKRNRRRKGLREEKDIRGRGKNRNMLGNNGIWEAKKYESILNILCEAFRLGHGKAFKF